MLEGKTNTSLKFKTLFFLFLIIILAILVLFILTRIYLSFRGELFQYSFFLYSGFILILIAMFLFLYCNFYGNEIYFQFKFLSEDSIRLFLVLSMLLTWFITPMPFSTPIIMWDQISLLNLIRGICFTLGVMFLPGSCLYSVFLRELNLSNKFKINNLLVKITFYPLLSITFIGTSLIILNFFNIGSYQLFSLFLFLEIIILYLLDLFLNIIRMKKRSAENIKFNLLKVNISKTTFIILLIAIGISFVSIGINFSLKYLIPGDAWGVFRFADSINDFTNKHYYPYFWSYASFGFSILSGLPLININVLLAPFCYLYVMTLYFFNKAMLYNFKEKYAILSTIIVSVYSGFSFGLNLNPLSDLILFGELYINYKGVALYFIFLALAFFIIAIRTDENLNLNERVKNKNFKLIIISALFIMISYMMHIIPLITGLIFIIIYFIFSNKKKAKFFYMNITALIIVFLTIFLIYDIITNFNQSFLFYLSFVYLLENFISTSIIGGLSQYLAYIFLIGIFILVFSIFIAKSKLNLKRITLNEKLLNYFYYLMFFIFFSLFMIFIFLNIFDFKAKNWILYYIDLIFSNIGIIGVMALLLSLYCVQKDNNLFKILIINILFSLLYASIIFIKIYGFYIFPLIFSQNYSQENVDFSFYWFTRNWIYAIPSLAILASIGIISLKKSFQTKLIIKLKNMKIKNLIRITLTFSFITLIISDFIIGGLYWGNKERQIKDSEVEFFSWMNEKFPKNSTVLTEVYLYRTMGYFGGSNKTIYFYEFEKNFNGSLDLNDFKTIIIPFLKEENVNYFIHYDYDFITDNKGEIRIFKMYEFLSPEILYNIENYLIPKFYNQTIYMNKDLTLYYAPYFNFTHNE